jgi:bacillithiol biosynthesis deacetylase BshB1
MGLAAREHLDIPDGCIENSKSNQIALIHCIRRHRPHIVLINAPIDRHPDHADAATLTKAALFYAGLVKIETKEPDGSPQEPWRPDHVLHYMQTTPFEPSFVVNVTDVWEQRIQTMQAFKSQFYNPDYESEEPETFISNHDFFKFIEARARVFGQQIGATYGEAFLYPQGPLGVGDLVATLSRKRAFI